MAETNTKQLRIAAVFATMNRAATARACVMALAAQTLPPDLVVVADNVSSDGTPDLLEGLSGLPFELRVHRMPENRGNAGGVEMAMDLAFEKGADAVWILDDDSWPRPDALDELLAGEWDPAVVRHSMQIDPLTGRYTWPLQVWDGGRFHMAEGPDEVRGDGFVRTRIMWTGALVSRKVRETVGRVNSGLFIRGEDEDYPWRIEQAGFPQEGAVRSILDHPGPENLEMFVFLGKRLYLERGLADWKLYYKVRNMVWLKLRQKGWLHCIAMASAYLFVIARIEGIRRVPLVIAAVRDGLIGRLGKWEKHV